MLNPKTFQITLDNAPLVSIDLCLVYGSCILLGKRNNMPLKGRYFTPGGRIFKNEWWQDVIDLIAFNESVIQQDEEPPFQIMGIWEDMYKLVFLVITSILNLTGLI